MDIQSFFADRVSFRSELPLRWTGSEEPLDAGQLASLNEQNLALLRAVAALEERHVESQEGSQGLPLPEVQRLEAKLDLILTLVGQIRAASDLVPPSVTVELAAAGLVWWPRERFQARDGKQGRIELSLAAYAAQPLTLPATIRGRGHWEHGEAVLAEFYGVNDTVTDALEKFVFRHHRRAMAGSRSGEA